MTFHGGVSAGVGVMAVLASWLATQWGTWAVAGVAALMFAVAWLAVARAIAPRPLAAGQAARVGKLPNKPPLVLLGIAAGLIIAAETAALMWSAKLLDDLAPSLAAIAGLGAAFFGLCNAAIRFPGDRMRSALGEMPILFGSLVVSITGFVALGFSTSFTVSVIAFASVGFGLALLIPTIFATAARLVPENRAGALSFVSLLTALPRTLAPLAFGMVATAFGMEVSFGLVAVGLGVALLLLIAFARGR